MVFRNSLTPLLLALMIGSQALSISAFASEGGNTSGGGDPYAEEFVSLGQSLADRLENLMQVGFNPEQIDQFRAAVKQTRIISKPSLVLHGQPVSAINHPNERLIEISQAAWDQIKLFRGRKLVLVCHEYASLIRAEGADYRYSKNLEGYYGQEDIGRIVEMYLSSHLSLLLDRDPSWFNTGNIDHVVGFCYRVGQMWRQTYSDFYSGKKLFCGNRLANEDEKLALLDLGRWLASLNKFCGTSTDADFEFELLAVKDRLPLPKPEVHKYNKEDLLHALRTIRDKMTGIRARCAEEMIAS